MKNMEKGFSLIELMVVVGIIGVLSAVALPQYGKFKKRAVLSAAYNEVAGFKTGWESALANGETINNNSIGAPSTSANCGTITVNAANGTILCNIPTSIAGDLGTTVKVRLSRSSDGAWTCDISGVSGTLSSYAPPGCNSASF